MLFVPYSLLRASSVVIMDCGSDFSLDTYRLEAQRTVTLCTPEQPS